MMLVDLVNISITDEYKFGYVECHCFLRFSMKDDFKTIYGDGVENQRPETTKRAPWVYDVSRVTS